MRKNNYIKRIGAFALSVALLIGNAPLSSFAYADVIDLTGNTETGSSGTDTSGSGDVITSSGGIRFISDDEITPSSVSFYVVSGSVKEGIAASYNMETCVYSFDTLSAGTRIEYRIDPVTYASCTGVVVLSGDTLDINVAFSEKQNAELSCDPVSISYGDAPVDINSIAETAMTYDGALAVETDDTDILAVDGTMISGIHPGNAVITITAEETDTYAACSILVPVIVGKQDLGSLTLDQVSWDVTGKVYDGTNTILSSGTVSGIPTSTTVSFEALLSLDSEHVGTWPSAVSTFEITGGADFYTFTLAETPDVTISPIDVEVTMDGMSVYYGDSNWALMCSGEFSSWGNLLHTSCSSTDESVLSELSSYGPSDYAAVSIASGSYAPGVWDAFSLSVIDPLGSNFHFTKGNVGNLTVLNENTTDENLWSMIELDAENSTGVYSSNGVIYVLPGAHAAFRVIDGISAYDQIYFNINGISSVNAFDIPEDFTSGTVQLGNSQNADVLTDADALTEGSQANSIPVSLFAIDNTSPSIGFDGLGSLDDSSEDFSVSVFSNSDYSVAITASDEQSGIRGISGQAFSIPSGTVPSDVSGLVSGTVLPGLTDSSVLVADEGAFFVFAQAEDFVGNSVSAASNAFVVDKTAPAAVLDGLNEDQYISGDVSFSLSASDNLSGINTLDVKAVCGTEEKALYHFALENTQTSLSNLQNNIEENLTLSDEDFPEGDIAIIVSVSDRAGNTAELTRTVHKDISAPTVVVSYDNNSPVNECYFNTPRTMTAVFHDKDFDPSRAGFRVIVDGTEHTYPADGMTGNGISLISAVDSEEDLSIHTDDRTVTYTYTFGEEGTQTSYSVIPFISDAAGHDGTVDYQGEATQQFVIDTVPPVIRAEYSKNDELFVPGDAVWTAFLRDPVNVCFTVDDLYFAADGLSVSVKSTDAAGEAVASEHTEGWDEAQYRISSLNAEANYEISAEAVDLAGNRSVYAPKYFTIDSTAPNGTLITDDHGTQKISDTLKERIRFGTFSSAGVPFSYTAADDISGILSVSYAIYTPDIESRYEFSVPTEALEELPWTVWDNDLVLTPDSQAVLYLRLVDRAGNVTYINAEDGVIAEATAPNVPEITIDAGTDDAVFSDDVPFAIHVADAESGGTYSGLRSVSWTVSSNGETTQSGNYDSELSDPSARIRQLDKEETVSAALNNSSQVVITVTAEDYSGNVNTASKTIHIDVTVPVVTVSYDLNDPQNGKYFNAPRTMTAVFQERDFDPTRAGFVVSVNGEENTYTVDSLAGLGIALVSGPVDSEESAASHTDARTVTYTYCFGGDGLDVDYVVEPYMTDAAGNVAQVVYSGTPEKEFTVDMVAPVMTVSLKDNDQTLELAEEEHKLIVNAPVTLVYSVTERNMTENGLVAGISASDASGDIDIQNVGVWDEKTYSTSQLDIDGHYIVSPSYTDLAGNSIVLTPGYFTLDTTAPEATLTVISGQDRISSDTLSESLSYSVFANAGIQFSYEASDNLSDAVSVWYGLYVPDANTSGTFAVPAEDLSNINWTLWDESPVISPDSRGVLYLKAQDAAGNVTYVNTAAAVIAEATAPEVAINIEGTEDTIYSADVPVSISVNDPAGDGSYSGLKTVSYTVKNNGVITQHEVFSDEFSDSALRTREFNTDFVIDSAKNNSDNIELVVTAADNAGNTYSASRVLHIDATEPSIDVSFDLNDPEHERYFNAPRTMTVVFHERAFDPASSGFRLTVNGENTVCPVDALTGLGIVSVSDPVDSEAGMSEHTDNRTYTVVYRFGAAGIDADYKIEPFMTDGAGNRASVNYTGTPANDFTVDMVAPVISAAYRNADGAFTPDASAMNAFSRSAVTGDIEITERNFLSDTLTLSVSGTDSGNNPVQVSPVGAWDEQTYSLAFNENANYTFGFTYSDAAGNTAVYSPVFFTIDGDAPTGDLITRAGNIEKHSTDLSEEIRFGTFSSENINFAYTGFDAVSGIKDVYYAIHTPDKEARNDFAVPVSDLEEMNWTAWDDGVVISPDSQAVLYLRLTDNAGNIAYINAEDGVIAEATAPEPPVIDIASSAAVFDGDVPITITVTDPENGGTYSGLKSVRWSVAKDGVVTQSGNYDDVLGNPAARVHSLTREETVLASLNNSNDVLITVEVEDYAGNSSSASRRIMIDATAPGIAVSFDNNNPVNDRYFNSPRTMTVVFNDRNFDPSKAGFHVSVNGEEHTYAAGELAGLGITLVSDRVDSEADSNIHTDARTNTYVYRFGDTGLDVDYHIEPFISDDAGNVGNVAYNGINDFTVDMVSPVLSSSFVTDDGAFFPSANAGESFTKNPVSASVSVTERNFAEGGLIVQASGYDFVGDDVSVETAGSWTEQTYTTVPYEKDANYTFGAAYTDLAGNTAVLDDVYFTIDATAPTGTLIMRADGSEKTDSTLKPEIRFGTFTRTGADFSYTGTDVTSGVSDVSYAIYTPGKDAKDTFAVPVSDLEQLDWHVWDDKTIVRPDSQAVFYLRLTDKAGNITYINAKDGVIAEATAPETPVIGITPAPSASFAGDVPFTVFVRDPENGGTYSGLKSVRWSVKSNGIVTQEGSYDDELSDPSKRVQELSHNEIVLAARNNSNQVTITVTAEDYSGNVVSASRDIQIDATKPEALVSFDHNDPKNGKYFNTPRTMTVVFKERNFDPENAGLILTINGEQTTVKISDVSGSGITLVGGRIDSEEGAAVHTDARTNTYQFRFGAEGLDVDYTVIPYIYDEAGNAGTVTYTGTPENTFTVDMVSPVISASYTNADGTVSPTLVPGNLFSQSPVTAVFSVDERNFSASGFSPAVSGQDYNGVPVTVINSGSWTERSWTSTPYAIDANYTVSATYTDLAGNSVVYEPHYFTVDATAPVGSLITIDGDERKESDTLDGTMRFGTFAKSRVSFAYTNSDATSGVLYVKYAIHTPDAEARNAFSVPVSELEQFDWKLWDNDAAINPDSQAVLYISITDRAGNVTYLNAKDGVIAEGTMPAQPEITIGLSDAAVYNEDVPFTIHVSDPENGGTYSGLKSVQWKIEKDGQITQEGNYDSELADPSARIQTLTRSETLSASLNNSNDVCITVTVADYAGNVNMASRNLSVDVTAPEITVSYDSNDPKNGHYFNAPRTMTVVYKDRNFDPSSAGIALTINGETIRAAADDLSGYGVTLISARVDSEKDTPSHTDSRTNTYVYRFGGQGLDADYVVTPYMTDVAGNAASVEYVGEAAEAFTVDMVAPVISSDFTSGNTSLVPGTGKGEVFTQSPVIGQYSITERNFTESGLALHVSGEDLSGSEVSVLNDGNWDGQTYISQPYAEDANYVISAEYTDLAGNSASYAPHTFTVDATAPYGHIITINDGENKSSSVLDRSLLFGTFSNKDVSFACSGGDRTSGVGSLYYAIYIPPITARNRFSVPTENLEELHWMPWSGAVFVSPDSQSVFYLKVVDKAGNISYINAADGVISESTAPSLPEITFEMEDGYVYNDDVPFTIRVIDPANGETYSGLRKVHWSVSVDGVVTQSGDYDDELSNISARVQSLTKTETVLASLNNSNNVLISVMAEDYSGNTRTSSKSIKIDTTAPVVSIRYRENDPRNGRYFNKARTMIVEIKERNFDPSNALINLSMNGTVRTMSVAEFAGPGISGPESYHDSEGDASVFTDDRTHTYVYTFGGDGSTDADYAIGMNVTDAAGNSSLDIDFGDSAAPSFFTIDEVAPVMSWAFTGGSGLPANASATASAPYYDRTSVTESVHITERNHTDRSLSVQTSGTNYAGVLIDGIGTSGSWSHSGAEHVYTVHAYTADANYTTSATYTDLAGNTAVLPFRYFTVDRTAPTGSLTTTAGNMKKTSTTYSGTTAFGTAYNSSVVLTQTASDETSGVSDISYAVYTPGPETRGSFRIPEPESLVWTAWSPLSVSPDAQGVVYLRIRDKAGNARYITANDAIISERTAPSAPVISVRSIKESVYNSNIPVSISVTDPEHGGTYSGLKSVRWVVTRDGTVTQSGNYDAELSDISARVQSVQHNETINAALNNSNNVRLTVTAEDYAGNTSSASESFAIDTTAPSVRIRYDNNDPRNGRYFNSARTMTVTYRERNFDPSKAMINITINGETKTVPVGGLTGTGIRMVSDRVDSEGNRGFSSYTDDRTNTYVFSFGQGGGIDADYDVTAFITDAAGNDTTIADYGDSSPQTSFTIDEIAPQLSFTFLNGSGMYVSASTDPASPYYDRQSVTATVDVYERNFSESGLAVGASSRDLAGNMLTASVSGSWTGTGNTHSYHISPYSNDGIYTLSAAYTDLAGNAVQIGDRHFVVDGTAPTGSVTISGDNGVNSLFNSFNEYIGFRLFTAKALTVTQTNADSISGVARIQYYLYTPPVETRGVFRGLTLAQLSSLDWQDWPSALTISPNRQVVVYMRVIDRAGNITYMNSKDGIIADDTAPEAPVITIREERDPSAIYGGDVPISISVSDTERGGTYSGLKSVTWRVLSDGRMTQSGNYNGELSDPTERRKSISHDEVISAAQNNSNDVRVIVEVEDYAGNTSRAEKPLAIDVSAPVIEVIYDRNDPKNDLYYDGTRTATVRILERNFSPEKVSLDITSDNGAKATISSWAGSDAKSDDNAHTCTVAFSKDAAYTFTVKAEDLAGNKAEYGRTDEFVIDTTKPEITVTYDENNEDGSPYYNRSRTAVILVKDTNFNEQDFSYDVVAKLLDKDVKAPKITKWRHNKELHSTMLTFEEDADYTFELNCTDLAGNPAETFTQSEFVIDQTKPHILFKGVENHSANRGEVIPVIEYSDINFDQNGIVVKLSGATHEETEAEGEKSSEVMKGSFTMKDFPHEKAVDDLYTLTAEITDLAGNTAVSFIEFSVNRFGSVYTFSDETKDFLDKYYARDPEDLVIYETNVDGLKNMGVTMGVNGNVRKLENKIDFNMEEKDTESGWTVLEYDLNASNFNDEGIYEIRIESVDAAGNRQDNSLKDQPISFAVDRTAPSVVLTGIDDTERYEEAERELIISATDNIALGRTDLYINGILVQTFTAEDMLSSGGRVSYMLPASDSWQTVDVTCYDAAGNTSQIESRTVLISTNRWRQFVANKPLFFGTIGGIAAVVAGIILFLILKRRKEQAAGRGRTKELDQDSGDLLM